MKEKLSVIMGIYNCEKTLTESIESIIKQTYDNWELIMCDDGSTDNTYNIAQKYCNRDKRIKLIKNNVNKGLAHSLNKCFAVSTGEYIVRHDADDICLKDRFEKQVNYMLKNKCDFIGGNVNFFDENGTWGKTQMKKYPDEIDVLKKSMFIHATLMIKREVLNNVNAYTDCKRTYRSEDYDLYGKLYSKGYNGENMGDVLLLVRRDSDCYKRLKYKYRIRESQSMFINWKRLNLGVKFLPMTLIPILKGLIPVNLIRMFHKVRYKFI